MKQVRLAIIGGGNIGARHLATAHAEPACQVVGVVDPNPAAAKAGAAHFRDLADLLAANRPDAVIVAAPTGLHGEIGLQCAEAGLDMLMEKPVTATVAEGKALAAGARAAGVRIAVGHHRRFDPAVEGARAMVRDGALGRLLAVSATWFLRKPDPYFVPEWRRSKGAGPILTNLIHDIDLLRHICGEIESVYAETGASARGFGIEDTAAILFRFQSGALGTFTLSDATPSPWGWEQATDDNPDLTATGLDCYQFAGTRASMAFPSLDLWSHPNPETDGWADPIARRPRNLRPRQAFADQLKHFCRMVRGEEEPRTGAEDGLATLAATEAVLLSAERGAPVRPAELLA